jgi:hypothetical protein
MQIASDLTGVDVRGLFARWGGSGGKPREAVGDGRAAGDEE